MGHLELSQLQRIFSSITIFEANFESKPPKRERGGKER